MFMKKLILAALCCLGALQSQAQQYPALSTRTRYFLHEAAKSKERNFLPRGYAYHRNNSNTIYVSAMIKTADPGTAAEALHMLGARIGTRAGDIWTVQVPLENIQAFSRAPGIAYIQLDGSAAPHLEKARASTRVDSVHMGYNLPAPFSGKNVLMGVIDFGFDYNHPAFYDTTGSRYRIKKVWELNTQGTPPAGYSYGHERTDTTDIKNAGTDDPLQMHGTAVASIAAGSGYGSAPQTNRFRGMAYETDMIFVGVRRDTIGDQWMQGSFSDFIDGINYIMTEADAEGKPAVVNISWGSHSGPHDGTTLFNQACDNLSGAGKMIVMSAGNSGQERIHLSKTFTSSDTGIHTFLTFSPDNYQRTWVDIWGEPNETFCAKATLYTGTSPEDQTAFFCLDNSVRDTMLISANGQDTCYISFITSTSEFINNKPRMTINVYNKTTENAGITVTGTNGTIHMWNEYYFYGYKQQYKSEFSNLGMSWSSAGNTNSTASDMGAAASVLLVGAYASKVSFTDMNGNAWSYSSYVAERNRVPFSSRGPLVDGRIKPDIMAPGLTLATATTSYDTSYTPTGSNSDLTIASCTHHGKTYYFAEFIGTSASAPVASGIVALMFEANPDLTPEQVKEILFTTAIKDNYTGNLPPGGNNNWGHGKINAYGAVQKSLQYLGTYTFSGEKTDCMLFPNPGKGRFTLDYTARRPEQVRLQIWDLHGVSRLSTPWQVSEGLNRRELNLEHLPPGMYIVQLHSRTGSVQIKATIY